MKGIHFFLILSLCALGASGWYSYTLYTSAEAEAATEEGVLNTVIPQTIEIMPDVDINSFVAMRPFTRYEALEKRNIYTKFTPKKASVAKPQMERILPKVQMIPKQIKKIIQQEKEPEKVEKKPIYYYRGTMMLDGEEAHIIEQMEPYKTHFLTPDRTSDGVSIVEIERYGISIEDRNGDVYLLPIKKE